MDRASYNRGAQDILETLLFQMKIKKIECQEVYKEIIYLLEVVREDKINKIRQQLGIF